VREKGVIPRSTMSDDENHNFFPDDLKNYKVVKTGDLVINKMKAWQGSLGIAPMEGVVSPAYFVYELKIDNLKFGQLLLRSKPYVHFFAQVSEGVRIGQWDLSVPGMKRIPVLLPSAEEQDAIVRFLYFVDQKVRRYVSEKRNQIVLLNEQKKAIINQAVTRGLDNDVKFRSTGIEWLGEAPEHWEVRKIRTCIKTIFSGEWGDDVTKDNKHDEIYCIRVADFENKSNRISSKNLTFRAVSDRIRAMKMLKPGDILIEKSGGGDAQPVGRVVLFDKDIAAISSNFISCIRPDEKLIDSEFLLLILSLLQGMKRNIPSIKQTTGIQNLDEKHYFSNSLALPPIPEQRQIVNKLNLDIGRILSLEQKIEDEIKSVLEYKIRLTSDCVTGKIDVRAAANDLSNELSNGDDAVLEVEESLNEDDMVESEESLA
jgi:type I restriction enzyme S subunit